MSERMSYPVEIMSKLLQLTPRRVQQLANEGVIVKTERGRYDLIKSVQGYITYLNDQIPNKASSDAGTAIARVDAEVERAKLIAEKALMAKYDRLEREEQLIPAEEVRRDAYRAAINVRRAVMNTPDRLAPLLAEMSSAREIRSALRRELTESLIDVSAVIQAGQSLAALPIDPDADCHHWNWLEDRV